MAGYLYSDRTLRSYHAKGITGVTDNLQEAIDHLDLFGYCLIENVIPRREALSMAEDFLTCHDKPEYKEYIHGDRYYQTLFGMMNIDDRTWNCAAHDDVLTVVEHFLGTGYRVVEACSKPTWPGAPAGPLHVDSAGAFKKVPDVPWMINTIWMLTDFTMENGATGVVPMSHMSRRKSPPDRLSDDDDLIKPIIGKAGSVILWHGGLYHIARANTSESVRVGLNIAYYPRWFNNWIEGGHQPIWPETYARMPDKIKRLCPGLQGRHRSERYEREGI